jgi:hypothetical protein
MLDDARTMNYDPGEDKQYRLYTGDETDRGGARRRD